MGPLKAVLFHIVRGAKVVMISAAVAAAASYAMSDVAAMMAYTSTAQLRDWISEQVSKTGERLFVLDYSLGPPAGPGELTWKLASGGHDVHAVDIGSPLAGGRANPARYLCLDHDLEGEISFQVGAPHRLLPRSKGRADWALFICSLDHFHKAVAKHMMLQAVDVASKVMVVEVLPFRPWPGVLAQWMTALNAEGLNGLVRLIRWHWSGGAAAVLSSAERVTVEDSFEIGGAFRGYVIAAAPKAGSPARA